MIEAMISGFVQLWAWKPILLMVLAIPIGCFFGAVPGLGGNLGLALCIPFAFGMDPICGFAFLLGMHAVVHTGGAIPGIMFGTPGTGPNAATVIDGFPMAQKGEAGRAIGAALMASGMGGILGAFLLALMIPVVRPVVLAFSPAEFFMMCIFGITLISLISGNSLVKGLIVGLFGLALALVGMDPKTGILRFGFGQTFLWDGVDLVAVVVGIFALSEMIDLAVKGGAIAKTGTDADTSGYGFENVMQGIKDTFRHWWLLIRCSFIGIFIGMVPGLGGDAASWIAYGHAAQTSKNPGQFGKGAVEGVIAPESANNSKEGGSLLPTVAFGVPGSSGMAILLGAFMILGLAPGPKMLVDELDIVWAMVWILVITNIFAVAMMIAVTGPMSKLSFVRGSVIIPFVLILVFLGSYLSIGHWGNLLVTIILGFLGYGMKKYGYPRPPLIIGIVLGHLAEVELHKAYTLWGMGLFMRPLTMVLLVLTILSITIPIIKWYRKDKGVHAA